MAFNFCDNVPYRNFVVMECWVFYSWRVFNKAKFTLNGCFVCLLFLYALCMVHGWKAWVALYNILLLTSYYSNGSERLPLHGLITFIGEVLLNCTQVASRWVLYLFSCFAELTYMPTTGMHTDHPTHLYQKTACMLCILCGLIIYDILKWLTLYAVALWYRTESFNSRVSRVSRLASSGPDVRWGPHLFFSH